MYTIDKEKAKGILEKELGYSAGEAESFLKDFPPIHDQLAGAVASWLENRMIKDIEIESVKISEVMQSQGYHFLLAVKEMNRLLDPDLSPIDKQRLAQILLRPAVHR